MKQNNIEWTKYDKINSASDAFIYLDDLIPFINYESGTDLSSSLLPPNFYTAGTSDNPDDYSIPEVKNYNKLSRLNPFNKNSNFSVHSYQEGLENESLYPQETNSSSIQSENIELINNDSKLFLDMLKQLQSSGFKKIESFIETFNTSNKKLSTVYFDIKPRAYFESNQTELIEEESVVEEKSDHKSNTNEEKVEEVIVQEINDERYEFNNEEISIDINNFNDSVIFEDQVITTNQVQNDTVINVENESNYNNQENTNTIYKEENNSFTNIENRINQEIINLESKIFNSTLTKIEFNEIRYQIFQQLDNLIEKKTISAIEEFKEKNKVEVEKMFDKFLRS